MTALEYQILGELIGAQEKTAGPVDKVVTLPVSALAWLFRKPVDLLFGGTGKGVYSASRFRPRSWTPWRPITPSEADVLRLQGRGRELGHVNGRLVQKTKGFGGLAGVAQRHPLAAAGVGGAAYLLGRNPNTVEQAQALPISRHYGQSLPLLPVGGAVPPGMQL